MDVADNRLPDAFNACAGILVKSFDGKGLNIAGEECVFGERLKIEDYMT
jgi:hypothetical protein